jgi:hypothetical protein
MKAGDVHPSLKGAGGGPGGAGPHASTAKPAGVPAAAAGARAGLSGVPGGGGGQHVAGAQGGQHQPSNALRSKRNGEEIIGDAEAVVPVLGQPARTEGDNAKPDAT